jgi:predicted ATPase
MQWSDVASYQFILYLLHHPSLHIKMLCSSRYFDSTFHLNEFNREIYTHKIKHITLGPLNENDIQEYLNYSVSYGFVPSLSLSELASILFYKTNGNPHYLMQV